MSTDQLLIVGAGPGLGASAPAASRSSGRSRRAPLDPDRIADAYWAIRNQEADAWRGEYRFDGALAPGG